MVDSSAAYLVAPPTVCIFGEPDCADSPLGLRAGIDQRETILGADGQVEVRKTLYSNDDQTAAHYEDGRIIEQHQYDGDGDQAWLARILFYSGGTVIDRVNFFAEDALPDDFAISIPPVSVPVPDAPTTGVPGQEGFDAPDLSEFTPRSTLVSAPEPDAFDFA